MCVHYMGNCNILVFHVVGKGGTFESHAKPFFEH